MKTLKLILTPLVLIMVVVPLFFFIKYPDAGSPPDVIASDDPAIIARGRYLANHVAVCMDCHSSRDWKHFSGPIISGTEGMGGEEFTPAMGLPGTFYSPNITPASIRDWSDSSLAHSITSGMGKDGSVIFPVMPWPSYNHLSVDDLVAIVSYIRTLDPIPNRVPASQPDFPVNLIMRTMPVPYEAKEPVDRDDTVKYGKYLVTIAACADCHTRFEKGQPVGEPFAGGREFPMGEGQILVSSNITPDRDTGTGRFTREKFINLFKKYAGTIPLEPVSMSGNTIMPWKMYSGMTEEDLGSIYDYLQTIPAVPNPISPRKRVVDPND